MGTSVQPKCELSASTSEQSHFPQKKASAIIHKTGFQLLLGAHSHSTAPSAHSQSSSDKGRVQPHLNSLAKFIMEDLNTCRT